MTLQRVDWETARSLISRLNSALDEGGDISTYSLKLSTLINSLRLTGIPLDEAKPHINMDLNTFKSAWYGGLDTVFWTEEYDKQLIDMIHRDMSNFDISINLGISVGSVRKRVNQLRKRGLINKKSVKSSTTSVSDSEISSISELVELGYSVDYICNRVGITRQQYAYIRSKYLKGVKRGKPQEFRKRVVDDYLAGFTLDEVAARNNVERSEVQRYIRESQKRLGNDMDQLSKHVDNVAKQYNMSRSDVIWKLSTMK